VTLESTGIWAAMIVCLLAIGWLVLNGYDE